MQGEAGRGGVGRSRWSSGGRVDECVVGGAWKAGEGWVEHGCVLLWRDAAAAAALPTSLLLLLPLAHALSHFLQEHRRH